MTATADPPRAARARRARRRRAVAPRPARRLRRQRRDRGRRRRADHDRRLDAQLADTLAHLELAALHRHRRGDEEAADARRQFQEEFGVNVNYIEDINDNDEFFGKVQAPLSQGQSIDRDIMVLTDWMAARMVRLGYAREARQGGDPERVQPRETLRSPGWDPNREYSMPWQSGPDRDRLRHRRPAGRRDLDRRSCSTTRS